MAADCGGSCPRKCEACFAPCSNEPVDLTCCDGIWNGDEEYVDCGGSCSPCSMGSNVEFIKIDAPAEMSWHEAKASCERKGFVLASIRNRFENREARKVCGSTCWIGLHRKPDCITPLCWQWPDGLLLEETAFNHWGYPGHTDLYKDGFTFIKITKRELGHWRPVQSDTKLKSALCSRRTPDPWMDRRVLGVRALRVRASEGKWTVTKTHLFYDTACRYPIHASVLDSESVEISSVWNKCADDHKPCECQDGQVRYGSAVAQKWSNAIVAKDGMVPCGVKSFGDDPAHGHVKSCYCAKFAGTDTPLHLVLTHPFPVGCVRLIGSMEGTEIIVETCTDPACTWGVAPTVAASIGADAASSSSGPPNLGLSCVTMIDGNVTGDGASATVSGCVTAGVELTMLFMLMFTSADAC